MVIYTASHERGSDVYAYGTMMDAISEDRFGEMHDSAVLWGMRREMRGTVNADDPMSAVNLYAPDPATFASRGMARSLRTVRNTEHAVMGSARLHTGIRRRLAYTNMVLAQRYDDIVAGENVYVPTLYDVCYECWPDAHRRTAHDPYGDGCMLCHCEWDGIDHDWLNEAIIAEGYMI